MPDLIHLSQFSKFSTKNITGFFPPHYFPSAEIITMNGEVRWEYNVMVDYPLFSNIHIDNLYQSRLRGRKESNPELWVDLRRHTERNGEGDIIYYYENTSYMWCWNGTDSLQSWDRKYTEIEHGYWFFHFENQNDRLHFNLKYSEIIAHETYIHHPEYQLTEHDK